MASRFLWTLALLGPAVLIAVAEPTLSFRCGGSNGRRATKALVDRLADQGFVQWEISADAMCPDTLVEIAALIGHTETTGPGGQALWMVCGDDAPPEARAFGVVAAGRDLILGTCDDVASWRDLDESRCREPRSPPPPTAPGSIWELLAPEPWW